MAVVSVFDDLIRGVRANGSLFGSSTLSPPWALHFVDGAPLTLCTVLGGSGWIVADGCPPEPLRPYDTIVVRGPTTFTFGNDDSTLRKPGRPGSSVLRTLSMWIRIGMPTL